MYRQVFKQTLTAVFSLGVAIALSSQPAIAIKRLTNGIINDAVHYGLINREMGLNYFLGGNWIEGPDGALLNVYTPYIEIARSVVHRKLDSVATTPENIAKVRKKCVEDIHYIYHHQTVKFNLSLYGDSPRFARGYYAKIEGTGKGRTFRLLPSRAVTNVATKEVGAKFKPYAALLTYHFKFEDIAQMDKFKLILFGKDLPTIEFPVVTKDLI